MMTAVYDSPIGKLLLCSDENALTGLYMEGQLPFPAAPTPTVLPLFCRVSDWLDDYFAGKRPSSDEIPLAPVGSPFQRTVWSMLCEIPYGSRTTYGELAKRISACLGKSAMSPQAVGGAVSRNPIGILIPCHRVLGAGESLTGFAGGLDRKRFLLSLEGIPFRE